MELRSGAEQLKDELAAIYKRMTDPEERRKEQVKRHRQQFISDMATDTGL